MTFEERMEAAERRRQDGNALFQQQQYGEAMSKYRCGAGMGTNTPALRHASHFA